MIEQLEELKINIEAYHKWPDSKEVLRCLIIKLCNNFFYLTEWIEKIERHVALLESKEKEQPAEIIVEKEPEEPLITIREFCNSLIINGNMIILPHNLLGYITKDRVHFEGCFFQIKKGSPVKVYRKKLMEKLPHYPKASKILKKFLEEQQKNGQGDQEDREGRQEDREGSEASRKTG